MFSLKNNELENLSEKIKIFGKIYYYNDNNAPYSKDSILDIKENSSLININKKLLCNYPFQENKLNHSLLEPKFSFGID